MTQSKEYSLHGIAGLVEQHKVRQTGKLVSIYNAEQAGLDVEAGPYATVCEEHGQIVHHRSLSMARWHMGDPMGWCEICNGSDTEA